MRIVIAGPAYPFRGGLAAFNERLARQFVSEGHEVEMVTFTVQYPKVLFPGKTQFSEAEPPTDLRIVRKLNSVNPFSWIDAARYIRRKCPDMLIVRYWLPFLAPVLGTVARLVSRKGRIPVLCIFDNVTPHERRPFDKLLTRYFVRSVSGAIVMSQTVLDDLRSYNAEMPAALTPHPLFDNFGDDPGREVSLNYLQLGSEKRYILFFGFIRAYKGLDILLEAFASSETRKSGEVKLVVAGEFYESDEKYREIIQKNSMEEDVILFDHFINDGEVKYFFSACDLVVQPYRSATQSGVTQIAYHFNKPMVVTDVGNLASMVPDGRCGYVTEPVAGKVGEAIDRFYSADPTNQFADGIREQKALYGWEKFSDAITRLLKSAER